MMAVNWKASWPKVEAAIHAHNRLHVVGVNRHGRPLHDLKKVLRAPHQHLLKEMIRMYSLQLTRYGWLNLSESLPPFHTNSAELGRAMNLCKATIHSQLERLRASGLVIEKEHRGRKNNYALRFAGGLLAIHPELAARRGGDPDGDDSPSAGYQALEWVEAKNLEQVPDASPLKKENKLSVETVENEERGPSRATPPASKTATVRPSAGDPPFQGQGSESTGRGNSHRARPQRQQETPFQGSGRRGAVAGRPAPAPVPGSLGEYHLRLLAAILWSLYRDIDYMAVSQLDAIRDFIQSQFEGKGIEEAEAVYRQLWLRIGLAEKWVSKKPGRYIPLPGRYFAPDNPNGFNRTAAWLENMRMTNRRAEVARQRFQYLSKSVTAVLHSTGKHLEEGGIHSYTARRKEVTDRFPHLATAFDWIVLDPTANPS